MHIARVYLATMAVHYVGDTGAVDAGPIAQSGFDTYERTCEPLRIRLKKSKRQPPTAVRDALGVVIALSPEATQIKPREAWKVKMLGPKREDSCRWTDYRPTTPRGLRGSSISTTQRYSATSAGQR